MPGGALPVPGGDEILPLLNRLQADYALVVATQDWHPAGHASFASSHAGQVPFGEIPWQGQPQTLWPDHCLQDSAGAALHPALATRRIEAIFRKGTHPELDSYSAFFDNHHRKSTGLAAYLRGRGVTGVHLAGLAADYCVYFSALDALDEGFTVSVLAQATRPISADGWAKAQAVLRARGADLAAG